MCPDLGIPGDDKRVNSLLIKHMPQAVTTPNTYPTLVKKVSRALSELEFFVKRRTAEGY